MGGKNSSRTSSKSKLGLTKAPGSVMTSSKSRGRFVSSDDLQNNLNKVSYPEYEKFEEKLENTAPPTDPTASPKKNLDYILKNSSPKTRMAAWRLGEGKEIESKPGVKKYPELQQPQKTISKEDVKKISKNALNAIYLGSAGFAETAKESYEKLLDMATDAEDFLAGKKFKPKKIGKNKYIENPWNSRDINNPKDIIEANTLKALYDIATDPDYSDANPLIYYWLINPEISYDLTEEERETWDGANEKWTPNAVFAQHLEDGETFLGRAGGSHGTTWDSIAGKVVPAKQATGVKQQTKNLKEITVGENPAMDELRKLFHDGDKVRLIKLGDEEDESATQEEKDRMRLTHTLLFGDTPLSILNQAINSAKRLQPDTFKKKQEAISKRLKDVSIIFDFTPNNDNNAVMQYSVENNSIIVPYKTTGNLLDALATNNKKEISNLIQASYHELTHAIHYAVQNKEMSRSIQDEYVADGFARMVLKVRDLNKQTFEQTPPTGYDDVIGELLQDKIFENTIPDSLFEVDPITREPILKNISSENAKRLIQQTIQAREKAIENLNETIKNVSTNLVKKGLSLSASPDNDEKELNDYIEKSINGFKYRKKHGTKRFEPVVGADERKELYRLSDDPYEQETQEKTINSLQKLMYGAKIPSSLIAAMQMIGLEQNNVDVHRTWSTMAKRALTKEAIELKKVMRQDNKDLELVLKILFK